MYVFLITIELLQGLFMFGMFYFMFLFWYVLFMFNFSLKRFFQLILCQMYQILVIEITSKSILCKSM